MLHWADGTMSAGAVDATSSAFASALIDRGVKPGDRVALMLQNDPAFAVCELGAWKAGAVVVPINPMLRAGELADQLEDAGCAALVCLDTLVSQGLPAAARTGVKAVAIATPGDPTTPLRSSEHAESLAVWLRTPAPTSLPEVTPDNVAVITYTSGTTGRSKGVCNTHANIVWSAHIFRDWVGLDDNTVVLAAAPLFHVTGQIAHLALGDLLGAPLVLTHRFDAAKVLSLAAQFDATFLAAAVTAYHALLSVSERAPATLNRLVSGAQAIPSALVDDVERWSGCLLQNIYGLTETTSPAVAVPYGTRPPVDTASGAVSVGIPVTGSECLIVDPETFEPVADGTPGEIAIRGPQVVPGYWRRPDADAEAFRDGWLRTGDLGIRDSSGWLYLVDRIKDLINAGGFKVSPREVEDVLQRHASVRSAAVVGAPDHYRGETVHAFVVASGADVDPAELTRHCRENLAAYKCPRAIHIVDDLPQTASGKVLRRVLREQLDSI